MNSSPEILLTLECTRFPQSPENVVRIRALIENGMTWMLVMQFAIVHGVLPLVADALASAAPDLLPGDVSFQFDRALKRAEARNLRHWSALSSIMDAFGQEGIRLLAFKGAALTSFAYGDLRLRESFDLDLWAASEDTATAGRILGSLGYGPVLYRKGRLRGDDSTMLSSEAGPRHGEFYNPECDVAVDLQNLDPQFYFAPSFDDLWEQRTTTTSDDGCAPTLSKEHCLLALAVHGEKHLWGRLNWMVDIDRLLQSSPQWDWGLVVERARRWRCYRRLCSTLALRSRLFEQPAPYREVAMCLADGTTERVLASVGLFDPSHRKPRARTAAFGFSTHFSLIDRPQDRAHYVCSRIADRFKAKNGAGR